MKSPDSVRRGLGSSDVETIRAAIRAMIDRLRPGELDDPVDAADAIVPLCDHPNARVRQTVADACAYLPDPHGEATLARLREDADTFVSDAATRASKLRDERKKKHAKT